MENVKTDNDIMLSVIIIFYNQEKYVRKTVESVLAQKMPYKMEILLGDDHSTDGTEEILKEYETKYPDICRFVSLPKEPDRKFKILERQTDNRIYLIGMSRGKYINFLDGDDYYTGDEKFKKQIEIMETYPDLGGCFHQYTYIYEPSGREESYMNLGEKGMRIKNDKFWRKYYSHSATFIYRNIYRDNTEGLKRYIFDDNIISLWHIRNSDVYYIPGNYFYYRQIEDSTWNKLQEIVRNLINVRCCEDMCGISDKLGLNLKNAIIARFRNSYRDVYGNRNNEITLPDVTGGFPKKSFSRAAVNYRKTGLLKKAGFNFRYVLFEIKVFITRFSGKIKDLSKG